MKRIRRHQLDDTSWVDHLPGWLGGHEQLFTTLCETTDWRRGEREMVDSVVEVPRLLASLPDDGPGHPILQQVGNALEMQYGVAFESVTIAFYRHGQDSVAWHGDAWARALPMSYVATLSLGAPRRFLLKAAPDAPETGTASPTAASRSRSPLCFQLGWGDLVVMGGACQRRWLHAVPKAVRADPRLCVMFRPRRDSFVRQMRSTRWQAVAGDEARIAFSLPVPR